MEKHRCKHCFRKFSNGRALGGHMRSHMMNLPLPPKPNNPIPPPQLGCETESSTESPSLSHFSSSSSSDSDHDDQINSSDHHDHEDFIEPTESSSLVTLHDKESETESFKKNPTRRRSKRATSCNIHHQHYQNYNRTETEYRHHQQPNKFADGGSGNSINNNRPVSSMSPVSSVSEVTSEEDLAYCLMMMSRDKWTSESKYKNKKKYKCETCKKVFRSYQALGGHRASHKKNRANGNIELHVSNNFSSEVQSKIESFVNDKEERERQQLKKKVHECPICLRVFSSGQALGGHKRSHVLINGGDYVNISTNQDYSPKLSNFNDDESPKKMKKMMVINGNHNTNESLIDLNLPAPVDYEDNNEEEISQIDEVNL